MNENPWRVDDIARLQRERIHEEIRQIRSEERAAEPQPHRIGLLARLGRLVARILAPRVRAASAPAVQVPGNASPMKRRPRSLAR